MLAKLRGEKAAILWTLLRLYLGWQWFQSGWGKVSNGFDATGFLRGTIKNSIVERPTVQGWYALFVEWFALPKVELINFLVKWGELFIGLGLILGVFTTAALFSSLFLNFNFMFAGALSSNPNFIIYALILLAMIPATYRYSIDHYLLSGFKQMLKKDNSAIT